MANQESIVITETSADGTETKVEITATATGEDKSIVEEVIEALVDDDYSGAELAEEDIYDPTNESEQNETGIDAGDATFHRSDNTDIGSGSDGETTYVIGEDFSYID